MPMECRLDPTVQSPHEPYSIASKILIDSGYPLLYFYCELAIDYSDGFPSDQKPISSP